MKDVEVQIKELELKIKDLEHQIDRLEDKHTEQLDENDIRAVVDQVLNEKDFASPKQVESQVNESHLQLIKWIIGTGISVAAVVVSIYQFI
ncbi:hypothetical protein [Metabacillus malikii]|uniref:Phage shock protein A n=1 Tax=Metabacillus malikii TaxID=1504265 RepID=A0ABT9ZKS4_9BACI|nr:hypothetical protein [Metabacillus malikii]MDQ0232386.1 phage shock protein A [Metabacillus malikii]